MKIYIWSFAFSLSFLSSGVWASAEYQEFVDLLKSNNTQLKVLELDPDILSQRQKAYWGKYDTQLNVKTWLYKDNKDPDVATMPRNFQVKAIELSLSKKIGAGVRSTVWAQRMGQDFETQTPTMTGFSSENQALAKNGIGASLNVDLLKNIGGQLDQVQEEGLILQDHLSETQKVKRQTIYLRQALHLFNQWILSVNEERLNRKSLEQAQQLWAQAKLRQKRGVRDNRELLVYHENVLNSERRVLQSRLAVESIALEIQQQLGVAQVENLLTERFLWKDLGGDDLNILKKIKDIVPTQFGTSSVDHQLLSWQKQNIENRLSEFSRLKLPQLELELGAKNWGSEETQGESWSELKSRDKWEYQIALNLVFPLENRAAKASHRSQKIAYKQYEYQKKEQLEKSLLKAKLLQEQASIYFRSWELGREVVRVSQTKYRNELKEYERGRSQAHDVVNFFNELQQRELELLHAMVVLKEVIFDYLELNDELLKYYDFKVEA